MHVAVHHHTARLDIGDVEEMLVGAAGETDRQGLADPRVRAVATGNERGLAGVEASVWTPQPRNDSIAALLKVGPAPSGARRTHRRRAMCRSVAAHARPA